MSKTKKYKITPLDKKTITIKESELQGLEIEDVIVVQIPPDTLSESEHYLKELNKAFEDKVIVLTTTEVKFCKLIEDE